MRIGIDARFFGPAGKGLGRYTQKLITHLEQIDQVNEYFIFLRQENWDDYLPTNPHFHKVRADYRWYTLAEQLGMPRAIRRQKLDVMHFTHFNVPLFFKGKFIVTIHDLILTKFPTTRATTLGPLVYAIKHWGYGLVIRRAVRRAAGIIAVSKYTKKDIVDQFQVNPDRVIVTYEAVDTPQTGTADAQGLERTYGVHSPYVLYVGNVYPHKNAEGLLHAFMEIRERRPDIQLVLVGKSDYFFERVKNLAGQLGLADSVRFPGFVPDADLSGVYRGAAVYVFPSFYEGFGLPALEACAYGTPVVASNSSCLPEILEQAAVYFDPHKISEMASAIERVLDDRELADRLRQNGLRQAAKFSWRHMANQTLDLYRQI
jgi:glycosyltransferase involved in cell wall biosynthesis